MTKATAVVKSNIVSQVPYFITFKGENAATKPVVELTESFRYYNNQVEVRPLYGATNINAMFNGKLVDWSYTTITLTEDPTSGADSSIIVLPTNYSLFKAGTYYQVSGTGEMLLVEHVDKDSRTVIARRKLFNTQLTTLQTGSVLYVLNEIEVTPATVTAVTGVYKITIAGTPAVGDIITVNDQTITLDATSSASTTAVATAIKNAFAADTSYTVSSSAEVVTFTEKSGKEGAGVPSVEVNASALTATVTITTQGVTAGYAGGRGTIWANPFMGPSATGYYQA